jgi:hypothetical protein
MSALLRLVRGSTLLLISLPFLFSVFRFLDEVFWRNGIGDWLDPYFINYLLEHWYRSVWGFSSPASPPMYFPALKTLGYSHGLVLFAPFYVLARIFFHPFQAYGLTLLLVIEAGIICLYLTFRRILALSFVESLVLTAFFFTSQNVINGFVGVWSQRASVFLLPPILLLVMGSARMPAGARKTLWAALAGLVSTLMLTQEFYTAAFALLFLALALVPATVSAAPWVRTLVVKTWHAETSAGLRIALVVVALLVSWTVFIGLTGGVSTKLFGIRIISRDWRRPMLLAFAAAAVAARIRGGVDLHPLLARVRPWWLPFTLGAIGGLAVFLWIYGDAYREHSAFPTDQLMASLIHRGPIRWLRPLDVFRNLEGYETLRTFQVVFVVGVIGLVPWLNIERRVRWYCAWAVLVSTAVLLVPMTFGDFSIWRTIFAPLPGLSVVRDPKRIAYVYELVAVVAVGAFLMRLPRQSLLRLAIGLSLLAIVIRDRNPTVFEFLRPNQVFDRWVGGPIQIDSSCRSFFIKPPAAEYDRPGGDISTVSSVDAMFVSLEHSLPTLNGYSAWAPDGWELANPRAPQYIDRVRDWASRHQLTGVCEFDSERRVMVSVGPDGGALTPRGHRNADR